MSKHEKLILKLLDRTSIVTYSEIVSLLSKLGYIESQKGKTSGSRVAFINLETKHIIRLHKPHPGNELKDYVKKYIIKELQDKEIL